MYAELIDSMNRQIILWQRDEPEDDWWAYQREYKAAADALAAMAAEVEGLRRAVNIADQHFRSSFYGPDADKAERASLRGVKRAVRAALTKGQSTDAG